MSTRPVLILKPVGLVPLFLAVCLSLATAASLSAETLPQSSVDQKVKDFMALVSTSDFASKGLARFGGPLRVTVISSDPVRDTKFVDQELSALRTDIGLDIALGRSVNIAVIFTKNPKEDMKSRYLPLFKRLYRPGSDPQELIDGFADKADTCFPMYGWVSADDYVYIDSGMIVLREGLDGPTIHGCLARSFYRLLGLFNYLEPGRPSTFSEASAFLEPMDYDRTMIRTLYDRRLRSGMKRAEVEAQAKAILSAPEPDDPAEILDLFTQTALGNFLEDGIVRKWDRPIRVALAGQYHLKAVASVEGQVERLAKATGLDFRLAANGEKPNIVLLFTDDPPADLAGPYRQLATKFSKGPIEKWLDTSFQSRFANAVLDGNSIKSILVVLPRPTSSAMFEWNLSRALLLAVGISPKADSHERSVLSGFSSTIYPTKTDLRVIATLYAPEVRAGMNRDEAIEAARVAIARISASRQR